MHHNGSLCSLFFLSVFINVPLEETLQICVNKQYTLPVDLPNLPRAVLKKLLEFATKKAT